MNKQDDTRATRVDGGSSNSPATAADEAPFDPNGLIGQTLDERYELTECIGRGGMGVVYLANQRSLDREVVVKVLPPSMIDDAEARARFEREAAGMSKLQHPHIVSIFDFGYHGDLGYIVMEHVEGITLRRLIKSGQTADLRTFGRIALQILSGMSEAHALGLVHRDIKPSNIMLTEKSSERYLVKILDFGLAKLVRGSSELTRPDGVVGTVSYMAPEQIEGRTSDERADVYSLGVLFYYMLCGEKPFVSDDQVSLLYQHVHATPERLEERLADDTPIPGALLGLIHRALAKDPSERPRDAGTFLDQMITCLDGTEVSIDSVVDTLPDGGESTVLEVRRPAPADRSADSPIYEFAAGDAPSSPGEASASGSVSESLLEIARQNRKRDIIMAIIAIIMVVGVALAFVDWETGAPSRKDLQAELTEASDLLDEQKLGLAEDHLELVRDDLERHPELRDRFVDLHERLTVGQLLADAELYREEGDLDKAKQAYMRALERDPSNPKVRRLLRELRRASETRDLAEADAY